MTATASPVVVVVSPAVVLLEFEPESAVAVAEFETLAVLVMATSATAGVVVGLSRASTVMTADSEDGCGRDKSVVTLFISVSAEVAAEEFPVVISVLPTSSEISFVPD